jgi:hypothetical protein
MLARLNKLVVAIQPGGWERRGAQVEGLVSGVTEIGSEGSWDALVKGWRVAGQWS